MDLMTMPLTAPGEAGLADASAEALSGLRGVFLGYPYGGAGALTRRRRWVRTPRVFGVLATRDRVTHPRDSDRLFEQLKSCGAEVELWRADGAHCFDEPGALLAALRYDPFLAAEAVTRFRTFLADAVR